jgi:hypothetical protein
VYANAQQAINIEILAALRKLGVDIAFPDAPPAPSSKPEAGSPQSPGG